MDTVLVKFAGLAKEFPVSKTLVDFTLFGHEFSIKWYGAIIAFGFLLAVLFGGRIAYKWKINLNKMVDVLIYGTFFGIVGARLYYVVFEWSYYKDHLSEIFMIRNGGLAIYGGIIFGIIAAYVVCRLEKMNFRNLLDMVAMSLLLAQGIGRWGNFANQEAFGTFTDKPWGMMSDTIVEYIQVHPAEFGFENLSSAEIAARIADKCLFVHPTFLYESISCILGFIVLYIILRKFRKFSGQLFLTYGVWYGVERAIVEGLRTDSLYISDSIHLRVSQVLSIALAAVCFTLLVILLIKYTKNPKPIEGVDYFPEKTEKEKREEQKRLAKKEAKKAEKGVVIRNGKIVKDKRKNSSPFTQDEQNADYIEREEDTFSDEVLVDEEYDRFLDDIEEDDNVLTDFEEEDDSDENN